jgi:hypothetical protein
VLDWFIADWELFHLHGQNWMLAFGGALLLYIAVLVVSRRSKTR